MSAKYHENKCKTNGNPRTVIESLSMTVFGSEFQMAGAEQRKARFANVVLGVG